jgi:glycosyltransferase involved in cell wall biosynthesis
VLGPPTRSRCAYVTDQSLRHTAVVHLRADEAAIRVLFVDHETRLSGGQRDLVDLVAELDKSLVEPHVALPGPGPLAEALVDRGANVHVVAMNYGLLGVSRWELSARPWKAAPYLRAFLVAAAKLARLTSRIRPDVIHSNSMKAHLLAVPAARMAGVPHVWHVRDILESGWLQRGFSLVAGFAASRVLCLSHAAARQFDGTRADRNVQVVYNGIRPEPTSSDEVEAWRGRLGAGEGDLLVGMVGQIAYWKGQDVFVEAAARLVADAPHVRFAIVGECLFPENEGEFEAATRQRSRDAELADVMVWAGPAQPIEPVMAALDILVHASRLPEPFGRVIVEAMAQGTPVVTTSTGAGPELVPAEAGRLLPAGDAGVLAQTLGALVVDRAELAAMSRAARVAAQRFDISATAAHVLAVYAELLAEATRDRR